VAAVSAADANRQSVLMHWGADAPEWVRSLAEECDRTSQQQAAKRLGVSGSLVNQVLKHVYNGRYDGIEARVKGELLRETVLCPVLGEISSRRCLDEQARPYANTNRIRVALYKASRSGCPNFRGK
jgi:DNA-binding transcriptional regulator YdaS (Cro superfamily)